MVNTFRLYGPEIGEENAVVDADVVGVTIGGSIEMNPQTDSIDSFTIETSKLRELITKNKAYNLENVDTTAPIWSSIESIESAYLQDEENSDAYMTAMEALFQSIGE